MNRTLAQSLTAATVDFDQLENDYEPMLRLVRELIGVVPNCDPYLEIWPIGFRTYNLLVPNLLNLPASLVGQGAPKELLGLAMYSSSRAAGCMYCSAHTCSFALRRGLAPEVLVGENLNDTERAVVALGEGLGRVPASLNSRVLTEVERHLSPEDVEWLVLGIGLMGFLNKFMDAMGIELEPEAIADVQDLITQTGWSTGKHQWDDAQVVESNGLPPQDSIRTYLRVFRQGPRAARIESKWTKGVSGRAGAALMMLEEEIGYTFPVLASLHHRKPVKAIATVLRDNLDPARSAVGLTAKCFAGIVFARTVGNTMLLAELVQLAQSTAPDVDTELLIEIDQFAASPSDGANMPYGLTSAEAATIVLAKAASTSPSNVNEITISTVNQGLNAPQVIEIVVWLSVLQMMHRLYTYYDARLGII
ncbi:MAG: hypothetical protein AAF962_18000 [Actinomycetota bacterium]